MFVIGIQNRASDGGIICYANLIINCIAEHMFIQINSRLIHTHIYMEYLRSYPLIIRNAKIKTTGCRAMQFTFDLSWIVWKTCLVY